jgi:hypothetical protein
MQGNYASAQPRRVATLSLQQQIFGAIRARLDARLDKLSQKCFDYMEFVSE